jgi:hypothetical protein
LRLRQHYKRRAPPRASARSAGGPERHPPTTRIHLLPSIESARRAEPRHRRSRVILGKPRRSQHHRGLTASRKCRQQPRQLLAPPRRPWAHTAPRQRRRPRPQLVTKPAWSVSLWPEHPRRKISFALPGSDKCGKIRWGHLPQRMARGLSARMPRRGSDR